MGTSLRQLPLIFGLLALWLATSEAVAQAVDDIRADVASGDFRGALQKINRRLPESRGNPQARYDLLMLRGEALVQLRQKSSALDSFRSALAAVPRDGEVGQELAARGMVQLMLAAQGWTLRASDGATFDIVNPETRKQAAGALLVDRLASLRPRITRAEGADGLGPMIDLMPRLGEAMGIEFLATGDIAQLKPIVHGLGEHARQLITRELMRVGNRTMELEDLANDFIILEDNRIPGRRGLHSDELNELREFLKLLDAITQTAEEGRRINRRLGGTGEAWDEILLRTREVESRVRGVLTNNTPG